MTTRYKPPVYSIALTVIILTVGAVIGALWGATLVFGGNLFYLGLKHPIMFTLLLAPAFATFAVSIMWVLIITPLWAIIGGYLFAGASAGKGGGAARALGVTFFSDGHPISQVTHSMTDYLEIAPVRFIGWYPSDDINAFAMGTDAENAMIGLSRGAVEKLSKRQLEAVIAHELGHVASNDMARMTYARGLRNALTFFLIFQGLKRLARWVFTPLSELELLRFSRAREFTADAISAHLTSPEAMISVLTELQNQKVKAQTKGLATAMMSAGFVKRSWLSTHPPLEDRIAALGAIQEEQAEDIANRMPQGGGLPMPAAAFK